MNNKILRKYNKIISCYRIHKHSSIQITIPTFEEYRKTRSTIKNLLKQRGISFDILLIDNGGQVYHKLVEEFPSLNFIALKKNVGHSGAQIIGAETSISYGYQYIIFSVNDVQLINSNALNVMKNVLESSKLIGAVLPAPYRSPESVKKTLISLDGAIFCYLFTKTSVIKKVGLHNFHLFIYGEDAELTYKISNHYKIIQIPWVQYDLSSVGPGVISNKYTYYCLRGLLYVAIFAPKIKLKHKVTCSYYFILKLIQVFFMALIYRDITYLDAIALAIRGSFNLKKDLSCYLKHNKYYLVALPKRPFKKTVHLSSHSLLKKHQFYSVQITYNRKQYYELRRAPPV